MKILACHSHEFTCKTSKACIPTYDVCNSFFDCEDKSDEANCDSNDNEPTAPPKTVDIQTNQKPVEAKNEMYSNRNKSESKTQEFKDREIKSQLKNLKNLDSDLNYSDLSSIDQLENAKSDSLSDYDYISLLQKQADIVNHLKELELLDEHRKKEKPIFVNPIDFLDSFMRTPFYSTTRLATTLKSTKKTSSSSKKIVFFHGIIKNIEY